ncbi:zinc ABC transporter substrate-binding protein [Acetobacter sp. AN02]|uniref:metal ABC transporter solute-binding protein, Zn/Mn family n=1 Tax=Acetobacter sp. AN02 TaxID=2894186 RepID=UPI0024341A49|nr:zinc ABC transporter substrate-binding protein [Acetobacter sp. AN02]MDG6095428.1 zinc ABC transporter substrate-binding protein [Acetobacter sp. AN02]
MTRRLLLLPALCSLWLNAGTASAAQPGLVAAESIWGDIAASAAGDQVSVTSVISGADSDPHLFEPSPSVMKRISEARLVLLNGGGYDPWMERLVSDRAPDSVLNAARISGRHPGDNPHIWVSPDAVRAVATQLVQSLNRLDPGGTNARSRTLQALNHDIDVLDARIEALRPHLTGKTIAATESIVTPLTDRLGLVMTGQAFQQAVINDTEPSPSAVAEMEQAITGRKIRLLIRNAQTRTPATDRLTELAVRTGIPVLDVHETLPPGMTWQSWMNHLLDGLAQISPE